MSRFATMAWVRLSPISDVLTSLKMLKIDLNGPQAGAKSQLSGFTPKLNFRMFEIGIGPPLFCVEAKL